MARDGIADWRHAFGVSVDQLRRVARRLGAITSRSRALGDG